MITKRRALIVSRSKDMYEKLKEAMQSQMYTSISHVVSAHDAKSKLRVEKIDLVLIQTPLSDEMGIQSSIDITRAFDTNVILLVKNDIYDQVVYKMHEEKVFVLSIPTNRQMIYQTVNMMNTFMYQLDIRDAEIKKLRKRLSDQKTINQAKLVLIENYHYTEEKAHKYLEKIAMDNSMTKVMVAKAILEKVKGD